MLITPKMYSFIEKGNKINVGQKCLYVGKHTQELSTNGLYTCAGLIMLGKNSKNALGHIDANTPLKYLVKKTQYYFNPNEINELEAFYIRGVEEKYSHLAIDIIEKMFKTLGINHPKYLGVISSDFDTVVVKGKEMKVNHNYFF